MATCATDTSTQIMEAARSCLLADGYANLSTRKVADQAGVPLSQIHYHFGGKQGMVLALLDHENRRLVEPAATDVRRADAAVEALRAGVRFPRRRPRIRLRPGAAGDDRRRLVRRRGGAAGARACCRAGSTSSRRSPARPRCGSARSARFTAADLAGLVGLSFLGGETVILLGDEGWAKGFARPCAESPTSSAPWKNGRRLS